MEPRERYKKDLEKEGFHYDADQEAAVEQTQRLYDVLLSSPVESVGFWGRIKRRKQKPIRGLYFWGSVGRGKTYLMDSFHYCLPFTEKRRVHFHHFMQDIHDVLKTLPKSPDPLPIVAKKIAESTRVLCLDEFHVHDIADAILMAGLLQALFDNGVTLVMTSNVAIDDLYKNGLQRELFLHAIELLKVNTQEVCLANGTDYRCAALEKSGTYHIVQDIDSEQILTPHFQAISPIPGTQNEVLLINHRSINSIALADDVGWFHFSALCDVPLSAPDYIEIAKRFHTVLISDVPIMGEGQDDMAKRFIHLIDALYDHGVKIIVTAHSEPASLYRGRLLAFAFERTVSRLLEMGSKKYLQLSHRY